MYFRKISQHLFFWLFETGHSQYKTDTRNDMCVLSFKFLEIILLYTMEMTDISTHLSRAYFSSVYPFRISWYWGKRILKTLTYKQNQIFSTRNSTFSLMKKRSWTIIADRANNNFWYGFGKRFHRKGSSKSNDYQIRYDVFEEPTAIILTCCGCHGYDWCPCKTSPSHLKDRKTLLGWDYVFKISWSLLHRLRIW